MHKTGLSGTYSHEIAKANNERVSNKRRQKRFSEGVKTSHRFISRWCEVLHVASSRRRRLRGYHRGHHIDLWKRRERGAARMGLDRLSEQQFRIRLGPRPSLSLCSVGAANFRGNGWRIHVSRARYGAVSFWDLRSHFYLHLEEPTHLLDLV